MQGTTLRKVHIRPNPARLSKKLKDMQDIEMGDRERPGSRSAGGRRRHGRDGFEAKVCLFILMLVMAIVCSFFGPNSKNEYITNSDASRTNGPDAINVGQLHRFLDWPPLALKLAFVSLSIVWMGFFIAYALHGQWRSLHRFQQICHRGLFLAVIAALLVLKDMPLNEIPVSYCPVGITLLAEGSHLVVVFFSDIFCRLKRAVVMIWKKLAGWVKIGLRVGNV